MDTKNIKDFPEILQINDNTRLLGIGNNNIGDGAKITIDRLMSQSISPSENNLLQLDDNNKLFVPKSGEIVFNNPFAFGDFKYSDHIINNLSWLRSNGQRNSGTFYEKYYNWLLALYNEEETIVGISVKSIDDSSATDYDYKIDTDNKEFVLPTITTIYPTVSSDVYLYYFVSDVIQGANVINIIKLEEQMMEALSVIDNLEQDIDNVFSNIAPNYTSGERKLANTQYVANTDGWLYAMANSRGHGTRLTITITGGNLDLYSENYSTNNCLYPVSKNSTYSYTVSGDDYYVYFYPTKGAN